MDFNFCTRVISVTVGFRVRVTCLSRPEVMRSLRHFLQAQHLEKEAPIKAAVDIHSTRRGREPAAVHPDTTESVV